MAKKSNKKQSGIFILLILVFAILFVTKGNLLNFSMGTFSTVGLNPIRNNSQCTFITNDADHSYSNDGTWISVNPDGTNMRSYGKSTVSKIIFRTNDTTYSDSSAIAYTPYCGTILSTYIYDSKSTSDTLTGLCSDSTILTGTGATLKSIVPGGFISKQNTRLFSDGTNLYICDDDTNGVYGWRKYVPSTNVIISTSYDAVLGSTNERQCSFSFSCSSPNAYNLTTQTIEGNKICSYNNDLSKLFINGYMYDQSIQVPGAKTDCIDLTCTENATKCSGFYELKCTNQSLWPTQGVLIKDKCGVECVADYQCSSLTECDTSTFKCVASPTKQAAYALAQSATAQQQNSNLTNLLTETKTQLSSVQSQLSSLQTQQASTAKNTSSFSLSNVFNGQSSSTYLIIGLLILVGYLYTRERK